MKKDLLIALLLCLPLQAMDVASVAKNKQTAKKVLPKEKVWLVHRTRVLPRNGCIVAGTIPRITLTVTKDDKVSKEEKLCGSLKDTYQEAAESLTAIGNTVHWAFNSLVYPHKLGTTKMYVNRTDSPYIIIEPLTSFDGKKLYGFWQDTFHLGPHKISDDAYILIPVSQKDDKKYLGDFKGTVVFYEDEARPAVEKVFQENIEAPVLYPRMDGVKSGGLQYLVTNRKQRAVMDKWPIKPNKLAACLGTKNELHMHSEIGKLQEFMKNALGPLRQAQAMSFVWKRMFSSDMQNYLRCAACKSADKESSFCLGCKVVRYCSPECQKTDWASHKAACRPLQKLMKDKDTRRDHLGFAEGVCGAISQQHKTYLSNLGHFEKDSHFIDWMNDKLEPLFEAAEAIYTSETESAYLQGYKHYAVELLTCCYGPEYAELRKEYNVRTLEGFMRFIVHLHETFASYEAAIDGTELYIKDFTV